MTLDQHIARHITPAYAAKHVAQYLQIRRPIAEPQERLGMMQRMASYIAGILPKNKEQKEYEKMMHSLEQEDRNLERRLKIAGVESQDQRDSWVITHHAGNCLYRQAEQQKDGWVIVPGDRFKAQLSGALYHGIRQALVQYWIPLPDEDIPKNINPDFNQKATDWMMKQIYERKGESFNFLSTVLLTPDDLGNIKIIREDRPDLL
ncbi:MAG: hypothetical protein V1729_02965 [Candidatus Woesearchaeota archaeon]